MSLSGISLHRSPILRYSTPFTLVAHSARKRIEEHLFCLSRLPVAQLKHGTAQKRHMHSSRPIVLCTALFIGKSPDMVGKKRVALSDSRHLELKPRHVTTQNQGIQSASYFSQSTSVDTLPPHTCYIHGVVWLR